MKSKTGGTGIGTLALHVLLAGLTMPCRLSAHSDVNVVSPGGFIETRGEVGSYVPFGWLEIPPTSIRYQQA